MISSIRPCPVLWHIPIRASSAITGRHEALNRSRRIHGTDNLHAFPGKVFRQGTFDFYPPKENGWAVTALFPPITYQAFKIRTKRFVINPDTAPHPRPEQHTVA